jgi:methanogenic corrinoid protein MtbC1
MDPIKLTDMIKVSDRLPEKGTRCLVYSTVGGFTVTTLQDRLVHQVRAADE